VARDELILCLNEFKEVLNDYYSLPVYMISIDEVHFRIIVPEMAYPLIIIIHRRHID
jgi:hypothetical protein